MCVCVCLIHGCIVIVQNPFHKVYHTFVEAKEDDAIAITIVFLALLFTRDYAVQKQQSKSGNVNFSVVPAKKNKNTPDFTVTTVGFLTVLNQQAISTRTEFLELLVLIYRTKLKQCCDQDLLTITTKLGTEVFVLNRFIRLLTRLMEIESFALPKLLEDITTEIDVELVTAA